MFKKIQEAAGFAGNAAYNASVGAGVAVVSGYLVGSLGHNVKESIAGLQANFNALKHSSNWTRSNAGAVIGTMFGKTLQLPFFLVGAAIGIVSLLITGLINVVTGLSKSAYNREFNIEHFKTHTADPCDVSGPVEVDGTEISNPINHNVKAAYKAAYKAAGDKASEACLSVKGLFCKPAADGDGQLRVAGDELNDNKEVVYTAV